MSFRFVRGNSQAPKGHAIFYASSSTDPRVVFCTYCVVPPTPLSLAKYLPSFLAAQLPPEELREATNVPVMPIPPMLEEGRSLEQLRVLAERRDDDLCDLGTVNPRDEAARMQLVAEGCQEYGQLYVRYMQSAGVGVVPTLEEAGEEEELPPLEELDTEELLIQSMTDRQRLAELGKLVGMARYALEGRDNHLLQETRQKMQRIIRFLPEKYRGSDLLAAAFVSGDRGARLAELYIERGLKLADEEYAEIPRLDRAIREEQEAIDQQ
jgi:hypothetical protein